MRQPLEDGSLSAWPQEPALSAQGSFEWHQARLGCVTASRVADVVSRTRSGYGAPRQAYMRQLVAERLTGVPVVIAPTSAMRWGLEMEDYAVEAYEDATGLVTQTVGFLRHSLLAYAGASPDRLVGDDGLLEVKCPTTVTHIDTLLSLEPAGRHVLQMQWQLACSGREWCDFVSYDPRMPEAHACFITRIARDDEMIAQLEAEVGIFLGEVEHKLGALERAAKLSRSPAAITPRGVCRCADC